MNTKIAMTEAGEKPGRGTVGIHLDADALRVVEMSHGKISGWIQVPYPPGMTPSSSGFPMFLKQSLDAQASAARRVPVWVVAPLPSLQVRFLSIPKARPRQVSNLVYWTFRKEIPFDPMQTVFDYDVEGEASGAGAARRIDATAYTIQQAEVDAVVSLFDQAGVRLEGVLIPSFALRNILRAHPVPQSGTVLGLYVGDDSSSLMFFRGRHVTSHRVFKTGMNVILDALRDRHREWSADHAFRMISAALEAGAHPAGPGTGLAADEAERIRELVHGAFARLVQQVDRSVSAYLVGRTDEEVKHIHVCGSITRLPSLVKELGARIGMTCHVLDPLVLGQPQARTHAGGGQDEGGSLAVAYGAALSTPEGTPNVLHTYVKREQDARIGRARKLVTALGAAALLVMVLLYGLVARVNSRLRTELEGYEKQLAQFVPHPDQQRIHEMMGQATKNSLRMKTMARRGVTLSALNTLAGQTPAEIKLEKIELTSEESNAPRPPAAKGVAVSAPPDVAPFRVHVDGMVFGPPAGHQSILASYILRLEDTDIFNKVSLTRTGEGVEGSDQVLLFSLALTTERAVPDPLVSAATADGKGATP